MKSNKNSGVLTMWTWNEKLASSSISDDADKIKDSGFDGFCIDPRFGLQSKHPGDEWMRNISRVLSETDAQVWICDDNRAFSGTANGMLNVSDISFQEKFLRFEPGEKTNDRTVIFKDGYHFYYDVNPYYIDTLETYSAKEFIEKAYVPYTNRFSGGIDAFVCRAPELFCGLVPWSFTLPAQYKIAYGEELLDVLLELFRPVGNYIETRVKFYSLVSKLFCENFIKPIYDFCSENSISLCTLFPSFEAQSKMLPTLLRYEHSDIPCTSHFSRENACAFDALSASSASHIMEKECSASILMSQSGYNVTFEDYKRVSQQHLVRGITTLLFSSHPLSLRGSRKYENPSALPLWNSDVQETAVLSESLSRIADTLSRGTADFDTLLVYSPNLCGEDNSVFPLLSDAINELEKKHIPFHIADELFLQKYARTDGDRFILGNKSYKTLVILPETHFLESTTALLSEFEMGGGFIATAHSLAQNDVCDNENLLYTFRNCDGYKVHYFVNNSPEEFTAAITVSDKMTDLRTGEIVPFYGIYKFSPYEGILLIDDGSAQQSRPFKKPLKTLDISGEWALCPGDDNILLLDTCDVFFDGLPAGEEIAANDVLTLAIAQKRPLQIECVFRADIRKIPQELFLVCENPDIFTISVNGAVIEKNYDEDFLGNTFSRLDISKYAVLGGNEISLKIFFSPSEDFLLSYEKALESPFEIPHLNYPFEISPICLSGDFSVSCEGDFRKLDKNASRYVGGFSIDEKKDLLTLSSLEKQGFPFFFGELSFSKCFNLSDTSYCIKFLPKGINSIIIEINGKRLPSVLWQPYEADISEYLSKGNNEIKITLSSTLRNLFGPHHIPMGELSHVRSGDFFKSPCVWNNNDQTPWDNNYCFIEFGLE